MSAPSVKKRVAKLEEKGIIKGYHVSLNMDELDHGINTFLLFKTEQCHEFGDLCRNSPLVTDLYRISGEYNYFLTIQIQSITDLNKFQESLYEIWSIQGIRSYEKPFL
jgi:DNA-binding Lrp family transcriptional regulator